MENERQYKPGQKAMIWGLLVIAAANILPRLFQMPNALRGILLGLGLGLEIIALVQMSKARKNDSATD